MGLVFCFIALGGALACARRGIGHGLGFLLGVGCLYGWLRANFLDGFTHFCFDAALLGFYAVTLPRMRFARSGSTASLQTWVLLLLSWPMIVILLNPFLDTQHVYVQIAGLRTATLFVPLLLLGPLLRTEDFQSLGAWAEWCVVGVSCFAMAELVFGLEAFFPLNEVTSGIYGSNDIAGGFYRIPASFVSAHAYGGTMVSVFPLFVNRLDKKLKHQWLTIVAIALAALGVFACGARLPVVLFGVVATSTLLRFRRKPFVVLFLVFVMAAVGYTVSQSERLRRFETLADTELVEVRIAGSVNMSFFEILSDFPLGKGLGSAVGTSVPFFLVEYARPPIGIESEFGRLLLEEGLPGLLLWLGFVGWVLVRGGGQLGSLGAGALGMYFVCASSWASGLLGAGLLSAIPGTLLLMLYMGALTRRSEVFARASRARWLASRSDAVGLR